MARELRQSTSVDVPIGPFLDPTDGVTPETTLTITQPDIRLKKNGGAWAQKAAAQTLTHEENGFYEVTLDATDTDTLGLLRLAVFESGAAPVWEDFEVVSQSYWDVKYGTAIFLVDVQTIDGTPPDEYLTITAGIARETTVESVGTTATNISTAIGNPAVTVSDDIAAIPTAAENTAAILAATVEGTTTVAESLRLHNAALGGKASGLGTTTATYRDIGDTKNRIVATVDADGNRSAVTRDLT